MLFRSDFKILTNRINNIPTNYQDFYKNRTEYVLTEGKYTNNEVTQTTSIFNTPYFVNAFQKGIQNEYNKVSDPYAAAGYLYLNSLPLSTLREKYLSYNGDKNVFLNFIAPTFKKFAAVHSMSQLWACKIGSLWYRYKKYIKQNVDILDNVWQDFDYTNNYNPTKIGRAHV